MSNIKNFIEDGVEDCNEIDEDLIHAYTCVICERQVCKDEVYKHLDGMTCECMDCKVDDYIMFLQDEGKEDFFSKL